jgi:hypothetical protein
MNLHEFCLKCYHGLGLAYLRTCSGRFKRKKVAMDPRMSSTIYCTNILGNLILPLRTRSVHPFLSTRISRDGVGCSTKMYAD